VKHAIKIINVMYVCPNITTTVMVLVRSNVIYCVVTVAKALIVPVFIKALHALMIIKKMMYGIFKLLFNQLRIIYSRVVIQIIL
jgi:hypothetical protein